MAPSHQPIMRYDPVQARAMDLSDIRDCRRWHRQAALRARTAGFDIIYVYAGHDLSLPMHFLQKRRNQRTDEYGGSLERRLRFPLEVFRAMRAVWPGDKPMSVRISATDWVEGGITGDDAVAISRAFVAAGADIIDVSAGQTSVEAEPIYGRMFQTPYADQIRNEAGIPTMAVGNIYEIDHLNSIIAAGRADLCCLARPHLADPNWTLRAAAEQEFGDVVWPKQYLSGKEQLERNLKRAAEMAINI